MSKINNFLKTLRTSIGSTQKYGLVSGNQSGDLDSVICAITYAYFSHQVDPQKPLLPFLNFARADLSARKDIELVFSSNGLDANQLYYVDDLEHLSPNELVLVDHNSPQGKIAELELEVTGIIDHHEDEGLFLNSEPRIIEKTGSCSTLVAKYWLEKGATLDSEVVRLLLAPLVIDTRNLTSRMETQDYEMAKKYASFIPAQDTTTWFTQLQEAKEDISSLTAREILTKDYKFFEFGVGSAEVEKNVGFSSVVKPFEWLLEHHTDFKDQMKKYLSDLSLDILVVMTSFEKNGNFCRQIVFIAKDESDKLLIKLAKDSKLDKELDLEVEQTTESGLTIYNQKNIKASRKQVVPALKQALESL